MNLQSSWRDKGLLGLDWTLPMCCQSGWVGTHRSSNVSVRIMRPDFLIHVQVQSCFCYTISFFHKYVDYNNRLRNSYTHPANETLNQSTSTRIRSNNTKSFSMCASNKFGIIVSFHMEFIVTNSEVCTRQYRSRTVFNDVVIIPTSSKSTNTHTPSRRPPTMHRPPSPTSLHTNPPTHPSPLLRR